MDTYWNGNGRHQRLLMRLEELIPSYGYTRSLPLNALIAAEHLYYDVHNNGGCNIADCYMRDVRRYLKPYWGEFPVNAFLRGDSRRMEQAMDALLEKIGNEPIEALDAEEFWFWATNDRKLISLTEPENKDGWFCMVFGTAVDMAEWAYAHKRAGFRLAS